MTYFEQVAEAVELLNFMIGRLGPRIGIVLGSGLGAVADAITDAVMVPYAEIPHFPGRRWRATRDGFWRE